MSHAVVLDNVEHHDLRVRAQRGALFGDSVNQALVFPNEFRDLQREYAILFRKDAKGAFYAVVLLGLDRDENLYLQGDDWNARYMPASQARGPFAIVMQQAAGGGQAEPKVQIDLDHAAVNREEGYPLFKPQGGNSPYLDHIINVLRIVHDGVGLNAAFFAALDEHALIEPITLEIKLTDTKQYTVPDVYSVSQKAFANLSSEALQKLHGDGTLAACHWVLASLDNVRQLADKKMKAGV